MIGGIRPRRYQECRANSPGGWRIGGHTAPEIAGPTDTESLLTARGCLAPSPRRTGQLGSRAVGGGVQSPRMMMIYGGIGG